MPSACESSESSASVKLNDSPGFPFTASGFACVWFGPASAASGCAHEWVIVSGLYWKMITFGIGMRPVGMNSTSAPRR